MDREYYLFIFILCIFLPGIGIYFLLKKYKPGAMRSLSLEKGLRTLPKRYRVVYRRDIRGIKRLGWWIILPSALALIPVIISIVMYAVRDHSQQIGPWWPLIYSYGPFSTFKGSNFMGGQLFEVREWLYALSSAANNLDAALVSSKNGLPGIIFLWGFMLFSLPSVFREWGKDRHRGVSFLIVSGGLSLALAFGIQAAYLAMPFMPRSTMPSRWFMNLCSFIGPIVGPVLMTLWYNLGFEFLGARLSGRSFNYASFWGRCSRNGHAMFLLFLFLNLPYIVFNFLSFFVSTDTSGYVADISMFALDSMKVFNVLSVIMIPLAVAIAVKGWGIRDTIRQGPSFYIRWAGPLMWMIPLFVLPFFLLRVIHFLLVSTCDANNHSSFLPVIIFGMGLSILVPFLSIFPLCYLYRLAAKGDESGTV